MARLDGHLLETPRSNDHAATAALLARAGDLLPEVVGQGHLLSGDVHAALFSAAIVGAGTAECAHRAADRAEDELAAFLIGTGATRPDGATSRTLRGWLVGRDVGSVVVALRAAGGAL